jgi:cytochrome c2
MPSSLRFVLLLATIAIIAAPVSVAVIHHQDVRAARISAEQMTHGNADRGEAAVSRYGCGGCHSISGASGAKGQVGPPLSEIAAHSEIAGKLANVPDNMILWLRHPQDIVPGNGMPDQGIGDADARDIAAYLYTLRPPAN